MKSTKSYRLMNNNLSQLLILLQSILKTFLRLRIQILNNLRSNLMLKKTKAKEEERKLLKEMKQAEGMEQKKKLSK